MQRKNARALIVLVVLILTLLVTASAGAVEVRSGETVIVPEGNVKGPLFISGNNITINADVNGDIFAVGQLITINGRVDGDIIAGANTLKVDGVVLGDIRAAAIFMEINGQVEGSVTGAAQTIELGKVTVGREVMLFGSEVDVSGTILGDALGSANQYSINGPVNGNVRIWDVGELVIGPSAVVGGNVTYRSANQARIDPAAQTGAVTRLTPQVKKTEQPQEGIPWIGFLIFYIMGVVVWGAFYLLFPRLLPQPG
ncbi:MAG: polymer-forming cytoskeletal protein, partial [Syntrophomonadaceae bacterium]|nr:polymer-forming cytoskeletal protein [Syntrophomonadaceae bacterium]